MIKRSLASILDQALLSGLNFSVGVYLIAVVPKEAYGLYVQLFAVGVLFSGVLDTLIANALANLSARHTPSAMVPRLAMAQTLARSVALLLAVFGGCLALGLQWEATVGANLWLVSLVFVVYAGALVFRDFKRVSLYLEQRAVDVLKLDGLYVGLALFGGGALHLAQQVSLVSVLGVLALANACSVWLTAKAVVGGPLHWSALKAAWSECWAITHWALPGLALGWLANSLYLYLAGFQLGLEATAELNASRLLLMPVSLLTVAWQQMARSDVANLIMQGSAPAFGPYLRKSALIILIPMLVYLGLLYVAFEPISNVVSADKYVHFGDLLVFWVAYLVIYAFKFVGTVLMVGFGDFLALLKMNMVSITLQISLLLVLPTYWGIEAVVLCLITSELWEAAVIWGRLLPARLRALTPAVSLSPGVGL